MLHLTVGPCVLCLCLRGHLPKGEQTQVALGKFLRFRGWGDAGCSRHQVGDGVPGVSLWCFPLVAFLAEMFHLLDQERL